MYSFVYLALRLFIMIRHARIGLSVCACACLCVHAFVSVGGRMYILRSISVHNYSIFHNIHFTLDRHWPSVGN